MSGEGSALISRSVRWVILLFAILTAGSIFVASTVSIDLTVEATGTLKPHTVWPIRAEEGGTVASVPVSTGDTVSQNQVLARFDSMELTHRLDKLQAELAVQRGRLERMQRADTIESSQHHLTRREARANLLEARATLRERLVAYGREAPIDSVMHNYNFGTHIDLDRAVSAVRQARVKLRRSERDLDRARVRKVDQRIQAARIRRLQVKADRVRTRLEHLTIRSPAEGVVLTEQLERLAGRRFKKGDLIMEVGNLKGWSAHLYAREQVIDDLHPGAPAKIEIRALRETRRTLLKGSVSSVSAQPIDPSTARGLSSNQARYLVRVKLPSRASQQFEAAQLRSGYSVKGHVITDSGRIFFSFETTCSEATNSSSRFSSSPLLSSFSLLVSLLPSRCRPGTVSSSMVSWRGDAYAPA